MGYIPKQDAHGRRAGTAQRGKGSLFDSREGTTLGKWRGLKRSIREPGKGEEAARWGKGKRHAR